MKREPHRGAPVDRERAVDGLAKAPSGIVGLDEVTAGGLPRGRPTLVCGTAGCGKTVFAMEFLVRGALQFGEPGVFVTFEERPEELADNVASLGFRLEEMIARRQLLIDYVRVERSEIEETGEYNLDGLFIRLGYAIDEIGARRVVLDTIETLFSGFTNEAILRAELRRLFRWLKDRGVTSVITAERGERQLTRQGLEEYVSDCVILLDHRVENQQSTRRLRVVKYRGSAHGTNEYPFLIDEYGIWVLPITALGLAHDVSSEIVSTGVRGLDEMLTSKGVYRGSSVLVSGTAGTGKTSVVASFVDAACRRGERCLFFAYEESPAQIIRNMRSVGMDLQRWTESGHLVIHATRPSAYGLERHLVTAHKLIEQFRPDVVVVDPVTNLIQVGGAAETSAMLIRLLDFLKSRGTTGLYTSLMEREGGAEMTHVGVSSLIDTWILLRQVEINGERNRTLFILKSRGMAHSNQVREFFLTDGGIEIREAYLGAHGVLTGSARRAQEAQDRIRRRTLEAKLEALEVELEETRRSPRGGPSDGDGRMEGRREVEHG